MFEHIVCEGPDEVRHAHAMEYMRLNQEKGAAEFGDSADNMTGILVYFDKEGEDGAGRAAERGGAEQLVEAGAEDDDESEWI